MRLVATIGDSHTQLAPMRADFALWLPIRIYEFSDGYYVTAAHRSVAELAGAQLLEVNGRPVAEVANAARSLMGADNDFAAQENLFAFSNAALMRGLGYSLADSSLRLKLKLVSGQVAERVIAAHHADDPRYPKDDSSFEWHFQAEMGGPPFGGIDQWISAYRNLPYAVFRTTDESRPLRLMNRRFFVAKALPLLDAFYIQFNFVGDDFDQQFRDALQQVDNVHPRRLIVDLRYNFGGDGSHVPNVAREFIKRADNPPWQELYVVTGRRTFSAGIMAALAIMDNTHHTSVGEPMGAPVNSYGDAIDVDFPRTGMSLSVSTVRHQLGNAADVAAFRGVDIPAPMSFADYQAGRDPAVDRILRGEDLRSVIVVALADGGAEARRAYARQLRDFSGVSWWSPPAEIELRQTAQDLLVQKRFDDALEVAALNTEIHPDIWNTWWNLGHAQFLAGETHQGLASWRRVLELDPQNQNAAEIRKALTPSTN